MGPYSKLNRPICVVDYDSRWPRLFEQEKERIGAALGGALVLVEHIGSTAVPGLAAKPVIDIGLGLRSLAEAPALIPAIESLGYIYEPALEQALPQRRFFWRGTRLVHTHHLHLAEVADPVLLRPLRFRDYLRRHPQAAREYGDLKKELAKTFKQDLEAYVAGKTAFIEGILTLAGEEILLQDPDLPLRTL